MICMQKATRYNHHRRLLRPRLDRKDKVDRRRRLPQEDRLSEQ